MRSRVAVAGIIVLTFSNVNISQDSDRPLALLANYITLLKMLARINTLAYFSAVSVVKKKSFIMLTPVNNVINLFTSVIYSCSR